MSQETEQKVKIRFKFRSGEEFEAEGNPDFIERQRAQFLYLIGKQPQDAARKENSLKSSESYYKQPASFATPALPAEALTATTSATAPQAPAFLRRTRHRIRTQPTTPPIRHLSPQEPCKKPVYGKNSSKPRKTWLSCGEKTVCSQRKRQLWYLLQPLKCFWEPKTATVPCIYPNPCLNPAMGGRGWTARWAGKYGGEP